MRTMIINGKVGERYQLLCDRCDETFLPRSAASPVACPGCGHTAAAPNARMVADYLQQRVAPAARDAMAGF
jgi:hypothetical protein